MEYIDAKNAQTTIYCGCGFCECLKIAGGPVSQGMLKNGSGEGTICWGKKRDLEMNIEQLTMNNEEYTLCVKEEKR